MKNKIQYFSKPLLVVFLQTGALLADSLTEVRRISTSTLARYILNSQTEKQQDGEGERREEEMEICRSLKAGSCGPECLIQRRRERKKEMGRIRHMIAIMNLISAHM